MDKKYTQLKRGWGLLVVLLGLFFGVPAVRAQSGPYGNEWIVPSQQYYKIPVTRDGIHRLDYQYLTQAGLGSVDPSRLQLWRRGREVAVYQGGARTVFDATTYLEFYGQRNDGRLDQDLYKSAAGQPHQLYSFYTDTAAYFLTYPGAGAPAAKRMVEPLLAGGAPHTWRLASSLKLEANAFAETPLGQSPNNVNFLPWLDPGEGFFSQLLGGVANTQIDSLLRAVVPTGPGPAPRLEIRIVGGRDAAHNVEVLVLNPAANSYRSLGRLVFSSYNSAGGRYALQRAEIGANGVVTVRLSGSAGGGTSSSADYFRRAFIRVVAPQATRWMGPRRHLFFANDSLLGGPATYELDSIPASVVGYDVHDPWNVQRVAAAPAQTLGALGRRFVFPSASAAQSRRLLLADAQRPFVPARARRVRFRAINPATVNFAIVSHRQLYGAGLDGGTPVPNAALEYAKYRASVAGGRYDTLLITAAQLYDQFHYGERSWMALRHFGLWLAAAAPANPNRYLLLLGKGIVPSESGVLYRNNGELARGIPGGDFIPTSSRAVSDNMITADFRADDFVPKLRTGRLTVTTPQQVLNYLGKLRTHEALGPEPWRKNVLHLVGGYDPTETADFRAVMDRNKARVERPLLGGHVDTEFRVTPNRLPVSINISNYLNAGISLMTYFGHGSNTAFALNFGVPSDVANNYNNRGKYPFFFLNGCAGNHTFTVGYTVVEDWLFADQKGALGSLGEYGFSYPYELAVAQDTLYQLLFNNPQWYGQPVAAVHSEAVRRLQHTAAFNSNIGIEQLLATGWQGDPALSLFAPPRPDFVASNATLSITPTGTTPVRADAVDFVLNVGMANPGKITYEPVEIQVTRVFPAGSGRPNLVYPLITRRQAWRPDTTYAITLPNTVGVGGTSTFQVVLDPNNRVAELSETNNTASIDFSFLQGGLSVVSPTEFAISPVTQPRLAVQSNDPLGVQRTYDFEVDTVDTFASGAVQRITLTAGVVAEWMPTLPAAVGQRDSLVWYWRARFHTPAASEDGSWVNASFRVLPGSPGGWSQSHYAQFKRDTRPGVDVSAPAGHWSFTESQVPLVLRTRGGGVPRSAPSFASLTGAGIYLQTAGLPSVNGCGVQSPNLLIAVYSSATLRPVAMPASFATCGQTPGNFYFFSRADPTNQNSADTLDNLNYSATRQQQLADFLTAVPAGSYVALVSANRLRYSLLPATLKARLQALLGSQLITRLADGDPLALVGQKLTATTGRLVQEVGPDRRLSTPAYNQSVELRDALRRPGTAGRIVSTRIGPARQWLNLYSTIRNLTPNGRHTLSVVAIDTLGRETVVLPNVTAATQGLTSTVDAMRYPYLRLELALADTVTRVPPQLQQWLVTSRGLPEGVVRRDLVAAADYAPATLTQQALTGYLDFPVKFHNISNETFSAPLKTRINLRDISQASRPIVATDLLTSVAPLPGAILTIPVHFKVIGKFGTFVTEIVVNPRLQPEQVYSNNELTLEAFTVLDNNVPPVLDVAFDGRHILNGELVSARPVINIQLNDEDKLRPITDRTVFTVTLLRPGQTSPVLVDLANANEVQFSVNTTNGSVAKLTYEPGKSTPLPDGMYTLEVQGRDPSNASAGSQNFQVKFEVVNSSQISNVYPYPNPVINKTRFVFTLTGQELPRNMKIQILSLTGRVVREIFMSELGPLHIGNNITEFAWDGTDTYGDRLANGTYLYRVSLDDPNGSFGHRATSGDKAFKNDWGKLVLMR